MSIPQKPTFGNGKIHPYPLGKVEEGRPHPESFRDGVRKILVVNSKLFGEIRAESKFYKRWFAGLVPRKRKPRKKQINDKMLAVQANETACYEQYAPVTVWPAPNRDYSGSGPERDSLSHQWRRVKEWDEYINDPMDKMVIEKGT